MDDPNSLIDKSQFNDDWMFESIESQMLTEQSRAERARRQRIRRRQRKREHRDRRQDDDAEGVGG